MLFSGNDYASPPPNDVLELSLIGPGYGEAILIHVGDGKWVVVDSCIDPTTDQPASLQYLEALGADPAEAVVCIVITHWDDDHFRGISKILRRCPNADVVISKVLLEKDFVAFSFIADKLLTRKLPSGVREIRDIGVQLAEGRGRRAIGAAPNRIIFDHDDIPLSHGKTFHLRTLSPCDAEIDNFLAWIASSMPNAGETTRKIMPRVRNDLSVVVYLSIGDQAILLGGDLEEEGRIDTGWSAILNSTGLPKLSSSMFKVPHHGSHTGHKDEVWTELLVPDAIAVIAPWMNGRGFLPTANDRARITGLTNHRYLSASSRTRKPPARERAVVRTIEDRGPRNFQVVTPVPGMVRARRSVSGGAEWAVELFGGAAAF